MSSQNGSVADAVTCIGPSEARHGAIYLHGIDSPKPSLQELQNRERLSAIANELNLRIAMPRANSRCSGGSICWGWALNAEDTQRALSEISAAVASCRLPESNLGLIGFSNGGYLIAKLFRAGLFKDARPQISWGVAVGSGMMKGPLEPTPTQVGGRLVIVIGKNDRYNYDPEQNYFEELRKKNSQVYLSEFIGGHELPLVETRKAISRALNTHH